MYVIHRFKPSTNVTSTLIVGIMVRRRRCACVQAQEVVGFSMGLLEYHCDHHLPSHSQVSSWCQDELLYRNMELILLDYSLKTGIRIKLGLKSLEERQLQPKWKMITVFDRCHQSRDANPKGVTRVDPSAASCLVTHLELSKTGKTFLKTLIISW